MSSFNSYLYSLGIAEQFLPDEYNLQNNQLTVPNTFVLSRTKIPEDVFYENFDNDWYLSASEAIKYGVAEKVIKSLDEII